MFAAGVGFLALAINLNWLRVHIFVGLVGKGENYPQVHKCNKRAKITKSIHPKKEDCEFPILGQLPTMDNVQ